MADTRITIDSEQVLSIASQLENDNRELQQLLTDSKAQIDGLANILRHSGPVRQVPAPKRGAAVYGDRAAQREAGGRL